MSRGILTEKLKAQSKILFGYEICQKELRLMPYALNVFLDGTKFNREKCTPLEGEFINKWIKKGWMKTSANSPWQNIEFVQKEFVFNLMEMVYNSYIVTSYQEAENAAS